jgi:hypothetical protein
MPQHHLSIKLRVLQQSVIHMRKEHKVLQIIREHTFVRSWFTMLSCTPVPSLLDPLDCTARILLIWAKWATI